MRPMSGDHTTPPDAWSHRVMTHLAPIAAAIDGDEEESGFMGFADEFLGDLDPRRWPPPKDAPASLTPTLYFLGNGEHALEVALATSESGRPRADDVRRMWKARHGGRPSPVLLIVDYRV